ncbi:uncharacterized protein LOC142230221 [Haematobia irritans]|uniref:uncharacterized protein LOC142230221 n=1 Tax=Haematobia irritans TaxID=7368 RepID=UPI003F4F5F09
MKHPQLILITTFVLVLSAFTTIHGDLIECDDKKLMPSLPDVPIFGAKVASSEEDKNTKVKDVLKEWSCTLKKKTSDLGDNVREKTKQWAESIRESFKKLKEKSKDIHKKLETKYQDFKERISKDSDESVEIKEKKLFLKNIPDDFTKTVVVHIDPECGHGHILDALGNCKKLKDYEGFK